VKVSVCMASFDGEKYIASQLTSILSQLGPDDEIIIVDDASRDGTVSLIKGLHDNRIKLVINEKNLGVVRSFSRAIELASGSVIFLSDQDDIWKPYKVSAILSEFASDPSLTLVLSNADLIDATGEPVDTSFRSGQRFRGGILSTLVKNRYQGCTMAFRREIAEAAIPFPASIPMHDSWIGIVNALIGKVKFIDAKLIFYRRHEATVTGRNKLSLSRRVKDRWLLCSNLVCRAYRLRERRRNSVREAAV
jgi:glycosyltransferase involved in cell wall biosynthesis